MIRMTKEKQTALDWIKENEKRLSDFHQSRDRIEIHRHFNRLTN